MKNKNKTLDNQKNIANIVLKYGQVTVKTGSAHVFFKLILSESKLILSEKRQDIQLEINTFLLE